MVIRVCRTRYVYTQLSVEINMLVFCVYVCLSLYICVFFDICISFCISACIIICMSVCTCMYISIQYYFRCRHLRLFMAMNLQPCPHHALALPPLCFRLAPIMLWSCPHHALALPPSCFSPAPPSCFSPAPIML